MTTCALCNLQEANTRQSRSPDSHHHLPLVDRQPKVMQRILVCCVLNGAVFYAADLFFVRLVLPISRVAFHLVAGAAAGVNNSSTAETRGEMTARSDDGDLWRDRVEPSLTLLEAVALTAPLFVTCRCLNAVLFQEVADSAFAQSRVRPRAMPSLSVMVSDIVTSAVVELLFLAQAGMCSYLPLPRLAAALRLFHMSLLNALYSFEYKW